MPLKLEINWLIKQLEMQNAIDLEKGGEFLLTKQ